MKQFRIRTIAYKLFPKKFTTTPPPPPDPMSTPCTQNNTCTGFTLLLESWPQDLVIPANRTSGNWLDLEELIASSSVVVLKDGQPDEGDFLLEKLAKSKRTAGSAIRWAVAAGEDGTLELQVQALPCQGETASSKPTLAGDNVPVIVLKRVPVWANMFSGAEAAGPVPVLCYTDLSEAKEAVEGNPDKWHLELQIFYFSSAWILFKK